MQALTFHTLCFATTSFTLGVSGARGDAGSGRFIMALRSRSDGSDRRNAARGGAAAMSERSATKGASVVAQVRVGRPDPLCMGTTLVVFDCRWCALLVRVRC